MRTAVFTVVTALGILSAGASNELAARPATGRAAPAPAAAKPDATSVIAGCAEAMGGGSRIKALRTLRVEVVYPDHGDEPVRHEIRRPNQCRTERAGRYVLIFDGRRASYQELDRANPARGPQIVPAAQTADLDVDIAWLVPAFFDYPADYLGTADSAGTLCHQLGVTLPLGARATYFVDASTGLVKTIAADVTVEGKKYHLEREWLSYRTVQGIRYPSAMTYPGRDGTTQTALFKTVVFNPVFDEARFRVPVEAK